MMPANRRQGSLRSGCSLTVCATAPRLLDLQCAGLRHRKKINVKRVNC